MKIKLLTLFLALAALLPLAARAQNTLTYTTNSGAITITGYTGSSSSVTNVVIPATLNGYPVTTIGSYAFQSCLSLTNATIPSSITNLGTLVFSYCTSLTNIAVDAANPAYSSVNGVLFNKAQTTLIECPAGLGSYVIPGSVTNIGNYAFEYCIKLTSVTIPGSVTSIGSYAFAYCYDLTSVTIPVSVTSIGSYAFEDCTVLTNITVDAANAAYSSVNGILFDKAQAALIECPGGFSGSYAVPNSVTMINGSAFVYCIKLTSVAIPASVTSIGTATFDLCTSLTNITVDAANPAYSSINGVLFNKTQTVLIELPDGLGGNYTIPSGVTSIGDESLMHCRLTSVTIPNSVTSIGNEAFFNCNYLTNVMIGSSVVSIGYDAFQYSYDLINLTFLGNAPALGSQALTGEASGATVYYYANTTGWSSTYGGLPTVELGGTSNPPPGGGHALVAYYSFEDDNLAATDFSGNGNTLSNYYWFGGGSLGITTNAAVGNYAAAFNDNLSYGSYYITTNASLLSTVAGSFSISLWLKTPQSSGNNTDPGVQNAGIVSTWQQNGVSTNYVVPMAITGTKLAFVTVGSGGTAVDTLHSVANVNVNQYIHVVVTRDRTSGQKKIYINGSLDSSDTGTTDLLNGSTSLLFGYGHSTGFYGELDDIQLYSGVLSADEVLQIYNHPGTTITNTTGGSPPPVQFIYTTNSGAITITGHTGAAASVTNVIIPATINGYPVTSIGNGAFENCSSLIGVTIPNSVISIGDNAFDECSRLTSVTIPNSVTSIGDYAFQSCGLNSITIPASVTSIGEAPFNACRNLTGITVSAGNPDYCSVNAVLFNLNQTTLIEFPEGIGGSYTVLNSVSSIEGWAFANCNYLTNVTIPNSVTSIGDYAFVTSGLTNVTIPGSVTSIGGEAFEDCDSLTDIAVDAANPDYSSVNGVLFNKAQTSLVEFPSGLGGSYAIPNSVTSIGEEAFGECPILTNVTIPDSVTSIGGYAFYVCASLTNVTIPNGVTSIEYGTFAYCYDLTSVTIPKSVTSIGNDAFYDCTSLTNVTFPGNAPALGDDVFDSVSATVYYYSGTTNWSSTYGGLPTVELFAPPQIGGGGTNGGGSVGMQTGGNFGFGITGVNGQTITIEASTNLVNWQVVQTITLSGTATNFTDAQWRHYPNRYYRVK